MGRASRPKPVRLAEKLRQIREGLGLSQDEMLKRLGLDNSSIERSSISAYELDKREPPLQVILVYARLANVWMDVLVDDELNLPEKIPTNKKSEGIKI
jgi:transcriptional regulator with XRE-family HTH domain